MPQGDSSFLLVIEALSQSGGRGSVRNVLCSRLRESAEAPAACNVVAVHRHASLAEAYGVAGLVSDSFPRFVMECWLSENIADDSKASESLIALTRQAANAGFLAASGLLTEYGAAPWLVSCS